jgi:hypothetical protein
MRRNLSVTFGETNPKELDFFKLSLHEKSFTKILFTYVLKSIDPFIVRRRSRCPIPGADLRKRR